MIDIKPKAAVREQYVQNIVSVWTEASEAQMQAGRSW